MSLFFVCGTLLYLHHFRLHVKYSIERNFFFLNPISLCLHRCEPDMQPVVSL